MIPRFQLKIDIRIVLDSTDFHSRVEGKMLHVSLPTFDVTPQEHDRELIALGGWKINVISTIDPQATPEIAIQGWNSLGKLISVDRLFIPFLYSTVIDYVRLGVLQSAPDWTKLLRLCYWYQKCLEISESSFHYKQSEMKKQLRKSLRNVETAINAHGQDFLCRSAELSRTVASYVQELRFAALSHRLGYRVSFHKIHDFLINDLPAEVKTLRSHFQIEQEADQLPKMIIGGQVHDEKINPLKEIAKFVSSKKVIAHINKALCQGGLIVFVDATNTFAGFLINAFSMSEKLELPLNKALKEAVDLATKPEKNPLPIIVSASAKGYEYLTTAITLPLPVKNA